MSEERFYSVTEAANYLGVTRTRVLELITLERLSAQKVGNAYIIRAEDVESFEPLSVGRPSKAKKETKLSKTTKTKKKSKKR